MPPRGSTCFRSPRRPASPDPAAAGDLAADRAAGCTPIAVCADAGSTSTGAVDPLDAIADYCAGEGIWLHVDAAHGGFAVLTEPGALALRGIERADSIGMDPHKWLFQPYEAGCLLVKDVRTLERARTAAPSATARSTR